MAMVEFQQQYSIKSVIIEINEYIFIACICWVIINLQSLKKIHYVP